MYVEYIDELIRTLSNVSIILGKENLPVCYEEGMKRLVDVIKERDGVNI